MICVSCVLCFLLIEAEEHHIKKEPPLPASKESLSPVNATRSVWIDGYFPSTCPLPLTQTAGNRHQLPWMWKENVGKEDRWMLCSSNIVIFFVYVP